MIWASGRKRSVGGTRYARKIPTSRKLLPANRSRAIRFAFLDYGMILIPGHVQFAAIFSVSDSGFLEPTNLIVHRMIVLTRRDAQKLPTCLG